eukprot:EG_transcript_21705
MPHGPALLLALACAVLLLGGGVRADLPAPELLQKRYDGFAWGSPRNDVTVELFGDFMCPVTAAAWKDVWKPLLAQFGKDVQFRYHMLPLPYHRASFDSSQAALAYVHTVAHANQSGSFFTYADMIFKEQARLFNPKTEDLTHRDVVHHFAKLVSKIGLPYRTFLRAYSNLDFDYAARDSWKWGVAKGVHGTPTFAVNGAIIDEASDWTLKQWKDVLRSLLVAK